MGKIKNLRELSFTGSLSDDESGKLKGGAGYDSCTLSTVLSVVVGGNLGPKQLSRSASLNPNHAFVYAWGLKKTEVFHSGYYGPINMSKYE